MKLDCWKCGQYVDDLPRPLGRREECPACHADLHCCRQCTFYDPKAPRSCREPVADEVRDKEKANFCGYFTLNVHAHTGRDSSADQKARDDLAALFGEETSPRDGDGGPLDEAERARRKLESMFDLPKPSGDS